MVWSLINLYTVLPAIVYYLVTVVWLGVIIYFWSLPLTPPIRTSINIIDGCLLLTSLIEACLLVIDNADNAYLPQ